MVQAMHTLYTCMYTATRSLRTLFPTPKPEMKPLSWFEARASSPTHELLPSAQALEEGKIPREAEWKQILTLNWNWYSFMEFLASGFVPVISRSDFRVIA